MRHGCISMPSLRAPAHSCLALTLRVLIAWLLCRLSACMWCACVLVMVASGSHFMLLGHCILCGRSSLLCPPPSSAYAFMQGDM